MDLCDHNAYMKLLLMRFNAEHSEAVVLLLICSLFKYHGNYNNNNNNNNKDSYPNMHRNLANKLIGISTKGIRAFMRLRVGIWTEKKIQQVSNINA